jgi:DNA (cytosine-5)-methyltransferase 1
MSLRLLDLFCGGGGAGMGYSRAGFEVTGVDHRPMPRYPFSFVQADALEYLTEHGDEYDVIHASPPCQAYSRARNTSGARGRSYPDLIPACLVALAASGKPWIVENVPGAPLWPALVLCGTMFGLPLRRHRLFASSLFLLAPSALCRHRAGDLTLFGHCVQITGSHGAAYRAGSGRTHYRPLRTSTEAGAKAMGIDWMDRKGLSQAIPPAYTEFLGRQMRRILEG